MHLLFEWDMLSPHAVKISIGCDIDVTKHQKDNLNVSLNDP